MKQNTKNFTPGIKLHNIILFAGILTILFFAPRVSKAQIEPGSFEFEGLNRNYFVFLPQNYQPNMPVVFNLHGYSANAQWQIDYTLMNEVADTSGFIVVYPNAVYPGFNGGVWIPLSPQLDTTINDVGFISALIDTINVHYDIDTNRIYCCGLSNGGQMTYRLTCQLGHRFAAVASVSGLVSDKSAAGCLSYPPIPILHMHGTADDIVPYNGSTYTWSVEETLNFWLDKNGCSFPADTVFLSDLDPTDGCTVQKISYTNCEDNSSLIFYKVIDGGHSWPGAPVNYEWSYPTNRDINANIEIWNFFKDYPSIHCLPEGITFTTQAQIDSFPINYPNCTEIEGDVEINGGDITNLNGLYVLTSIDGSLIIGSGFYMGQMGNFSLTSLSGLDNLSYIGDELKIAGNAALTNLTGLENITSIEGGLHIGTHMYDWHLGNPNITSLTGLNNLSSIGGILEIYDNDVLISIAALNNVTSIGGLKIGSNEILADLTALQGLTSIGGNMYIRGNPALTSLGGLDNIDFNTITQLDIWLNQNLTICDVQSICDYLASPNATVAIGNNAPGCNSKQEVEDACASSINEMGFINGLTIIPNPFSTSTTIEYELKKTSNVQIIIYNHLGEQIEMFEKRQSAGKQKIVWNAEGIPGGVYYSMLKTASGSQTMKMVKVR